MTRTDHNAEIKNRRKQHRKKALFPTIIFMMLLSATVAFFISVTPKAVGSLKYDSHGLGSSETSATVLSEIEEPKATSYSYLGKYWVTGYDICFDCCGKTDGITASGEYATIGKTVAASEELPFGFVLYIDGIGTRTVEDRGGVIEGNRLDVLCENHEECYAITGWYDVYIFD